jgi:hypothetical protein
MSENDFECLASTGVNTPGTMFPDFRSFVIQQDMDNGLTEEQAGRVVLRFLCESAGCSFRPPYVKDVFKKWGSGVMKDSLYRVGSGESIF